MGHGEKCPTLSDGSVLSFWDDLGQLQCVNASFVLSGAERGRQCRGDEILNQNYVGCTFECPDYHFYNFHTKRCELKECSPLTQLITKEGTCYSC